MADYYDFKGVKRSEGDSFYDSKGVLRAPGEDFYDGKDVLRSPGDRYYDANGFLCDPASSGFHAGGKNGFALGAAVGYIIAAAVLGLFCKWVSPFVMFVFNWLYLPAMLVMYSVFMKKWLGWGADKQSLYKLLGASAAMSLLMRVLGGIYINSGLTGWSAFIVFALCYLPLVAYSIALPLLSPDRQSRRFADYLLYAGRKQVFILMMFIEMLSFVNESDEMFVGLTCGLAVAIVGVVSFFLSKLAVLPFKLLPAPAERTPSPAQKYQGDVPTPSVPEEPKKDEAQARADFVNYLETASRGDTDAMTMLGFAYTEGEGCEADAEKALYWWETAAEKGDVAAQYFAAMCLLEGYPERDVMLPWIELNAAQGTVAPDDTRGLAWLDKAALVQVADCLPDEEEYPPKAQYAAGVCYANGIGTQVDKGRAEELFLLAAKNGLASAWARLGAIYMPLDDESEKTADWPKIIGFYENGVAAGDEECCWMLHLCYEMEVVPEPDAARSLDLLRRAAEGGIASAMPKYGKLLIRGDGVPKDTRRGLAMIEEAAQAGVDDALKAVVFACEECGEKEKAAFWSKKTGCPLGMLNETGVVIPVAETSNTQDEVRFCHACGARLPDGSSFCPKCGADLRQGAPVKCESAKSAVSTQHKEKTGKFELILAIISILIVPTVLSLVLESLVGSFHGIIARWTFMLSTWLCVWAVLLPLILYPIMARAIRKTQNTEKPMWVFALVIPLAVVVLFISACLLAQGPFLSFTHWVQRHMGIPDITKGLVVMLFARIAASALPCTAYALLLFRAAREKALKRFWWCAPPVVLAVTTVAGYLLTASFQLGAYGAVVGFMIYGLLSLLSLPLICRECKKGVLWSAIAVSLVVLTAATVLTLPRVVSRIGAAPAGAAQTAAPTEPANGNELTLEHAAGFMGNTPGNMSNWGFCCEGEYKGEAIWYIGLNDGLHILHSDKTVTQLADDGWYTDLLYTGETLVYTREYDESMVEICVGLPSEHTVVESTDLNHATLYSNNLLGDTLYGSIEDSTGEGSSFVYDITTGEMNGMTGPCAYLTEERLYYFINTPEAKDLMYMSVETNTPSLVANVDSSTTGVMLELDGKLYLKGDEGASSFDLLTGEMEAAPFEGIFINTDGEFIYWVSAQLELCRYDPDSGAVDVLCSLADELTGPNGELWPVQLSYTDMGFVLTPLLSNVLLLVDADDYSVQTLISSGDEGLRYRSEASYSEPAYEEPDTEFPVEDTVGEVNLFAVCAALDGMFGEIQGAGDRDSVNRCGLYDIDGDNEEELILLYLDGNGYLCWRVWDVSSDSPVELAYGSIVGFPGGREAQWAHVGMCTYGGELYFYTSHGDNEYTAQFYTLYNFDDLAAGQSEYLSGELPADCSETVLLSTDGDDLCGDVFANFYALHMNAAQRSAGGPTE